MESKRTEVKMVTIDLKLLGEEADWLKGLMQNPLYGEHPNDESKLNKEMRLRFWKALGGTVIGRESAYTCPRCRGDSKLLSTGMDGKAAYGCEKCDNIWEEEL